ncbi:MAG: methionyl-tRNA formyltransferase [bacterium]
MRIVLMGNKDLAVNCLDYLLREGEEVVAVVLNRGDRRASDSWYRSLGEYCALKGLRTFQPSSANDPEFLNEIRALSPDLVLSMSYDRILKEAFLRIPSRGAINIHFALLPRNRGCLPLVYALAGGERKVGVTIHYIDPGIDTGDIISQEGIPVSDEDTAFSLYFKCVEVGTDLFERTFPLIKSGRNGRTKQNDIEATYHKQVYPNDRWIDWSRSLEEVGAFIRAHTFPSYPGARTVLDGEEVELRYVGCGRVQILGKDEVVILEKLYERLKAN